MNTDKRPWARQQWWIIYNALIAPRKAEEMALHTGASVATVHRGIAIYSRLGPGALETPGKGGRRHQYLTQQEEEQFLAPFFAQAQILWGQQRDSSLRLGYSAHGLAHKRELLGDKQ